MCGAFTVVRDNSGIKVRWGEAPTHVSLIRLDMNGINYIGTGLGNKFDMVEDRHRVEGQECIFHQSFEHGCGSLGVVEPRNKVGE